jgi:hypothetical protein
MNTVRDRDEKTKDRYRSYYKVHNSTKPLPALKEEESVLLKLDPESSWKDTGVVKSVDHDNRTCIIETDAELFAVTGDTYKRTLQPSKFNVYESD